MTLTRGTLCICKVAVKYGCKYNIFLCRNMLYNYFKRYNLSTHGRKITGLKLRQSCPCVCHECVWGSGCKAPIIPYLAITWTRLVSLRPRHVYTLRKCSSGYSRKRKKKLLSLAGTESNFLHRLSSPLQYGTCCTHLLILSLPLLIQ